MKRILTVLMSAIMVLSMMPAMAFATGEECSGSSCSHVAAIGDTHYSSLQDAVDDAGEGDVVRILSDIHLDSPIQIKKSVTIDGIKEGSSSKNGEGCFSVSVPNTNSGRVFNCDGKKYDVSNNSVITLNNLRIIGPESESNSRGVSVYATEGLKLNLNNVYVSAAAYAVNIASENKDIVVNINNSKMEGWCAIQTWSPANITINNSVLYGTNKYIGDNTYSFATIVVNQNSVASTIAVTDSELIAESSDAKDTYQGILSIQNVLNDGTQAYPNGNELTFTGCEFKAKGVWKDSSSGKEYVLEPMYEAVGDNTIIIDGEQCYVPDYDCMVFTYIEPQAKIDRGEKTYTYGEFELALEDSNPGETIFLSKDVVLSEKVTIDKAITIDGIGKTLSAVDEFAKDHLILLTSGATVKNVTLDSNKKAKGIQVYSNNTPVEVSFDNVSFKNSAGSGITVNGTTVNLKDATFEGNAWQDVNVDSGVGVENDSVLNIGTGCTFNNQYQITSDGQIVDGKHTTKYGTVNLNDSSKVLDVNDVEVGEGDSKYTKRFWTVSGKPAPAPTPEPEDPITNTGSGDNASTNVDASDNTTTSDSGKTETTIDSTLGDKIVENAKDNNVADVVIKAETEKGDSTGSTVALPESTVQALAKDTEASVTIKTDSAEVSLDKAAVDAVAAQAGTDGEVKLVVETVENTEDTLKVELKLVTSKGTVTDFQGGNVTVTVPVSEELAGKKLVCVYIDDNGKYIMMDGALAADGKTFTFTTGHFSTYAILSEEEAKAAIDGQDISKASVSGIANKTYTGKAVTQKLAVKAGDKALVEGTDYTVAYSKNVNVGVASVKITGKGKYEGTLTKTFKINPKGTSISKVSGQKKAVKVVWKKQLTKMKSSYVSGYQVQYSTSSKFTSGTSKYTNAKFSKGRTTKTIKNLKAGKKYYVRVRTYKNVDGTRCYSSWSKARSVKTK